MTASKNFSALLMPINCRIFKIAHQQLVRSPVGFYIAKESGLDRWSWFSVELFEFLYMHPTIRDLLFDTLTLASKTGPLSLTAESLLCT